MLGRSWRGAQGVIGKMGGKRRESDAGRGDLIRCCPLRLARAQHAGVDHPGQHAVARGLRIVAEPVRAPALRQLRQGHEKCCFRDGQPPRLLGEIGERGGANALEVAAIGGKRQVAFEDFALADAPLDLPGAEHLCDLGGDAAAFARLDEAGKLHGKRRAARNDAAVAGKLRGGAQQRQRIDAGMFPEAPVLIGHQHFHEFRIDLIEGQRRAANSRPPSR